MRLTGDSVPVFFVAMTYIRTMEVKGSVDGWMVGYSVDSAVSLPFRLNSKRTTRWKDIILGYLLAIERHLLLHG